MVDIVIAEFLDEAALQAVPALYKVHYDPDLVDRPDELARLVTDARALVVRNRTQVRGELLAAASKLQVVGRLGVGLDNIDLEACRARNIAVCPASGANDVSVAEYVVCTAMMLRRGAYMATARVSAGTWPRNDLIGREVEGAVIGLVGFGAIARHVARRATALGMVVIAHDPFVPISDPVWAEMGIAPVTFDELLKRADVVSLHVPLTDKTKNLIDASMLGQMKRDAILINAARGGVVDERALAAALKAGDLGGAAIDVFDTEPLKGEAAQLFADVPNLVLTPHIAGVTEESNVRVSKVTIENVLRALS